MGSAALQALRRVQTREPSLSLEEQEEWEERAAIMEYDGGLSREEAEKKARARVLENRQRDKRE